jgi:hypothetical protein
MENKRRAIDICETLDYYYKVIHQTNTQLAGKSIGSLCRNPKDKPNVLETLLAQSHVLSRTSEREGHRVDMKDAAFVKMRDSVSFYKIDPDEYVLRKS